MKYNINKDFSNRYKHLHSLFNLLLYPLNFHRIMNNFNCIKKVLN